MYLMSTSSVNSSSGTLESASAVVRNFSVPWEIKIYTTRVSSENAEFVTALHLNHEFQAMV